jgi:hypothetical protein
LEHELEDAVVELVGSAQVAALVQGERGSGLVRMIQRIVRQSDESVGAAGPLLDVAKLAPSLLERRDLVVHSVWLVKNQTPGQVTGTRARRTDIHSQLWALTELEGLARDLADAQIQVFEQTRQFLGKRSSYS